MARLTHKPICSAATTNQRLPTRLSQRSGRSSMLRPTSTEARNSRKLLVPDSTLAITWLSAPSCSDQRCTRLSKKLMAARVARKVRAATASASSRLRMEIPNTVVSVKNSMMRSFMSDWPPGCP
ncbi:hypothetical protein D3C73_1064390 [compost metagenome]